MNLHQLNCFIAVVEEGSVSKAAIRLNMTQPPLSMLIQKLEDDLQVVLFERHKKRLHITEAGELLYERAIELLQASENIIREVSEVSKGKKGTVRIGTSSSANVTFLPSLIATLQEELPGLTIEVREGKYTDMVRELRQQEIDFAFVRNTDHHEDIVSVELMQEALLLAIPPNHPLQQQQVIRMKDLKDEPFLMQRTTQGLNISHTVSEACQIAGFEPRIVYQGTTSFPILFMVQQGAGLAFIPESFLLFHQQMRLPTLRKIEDATLITKQSLLLLKNRYRTATVDEVIARMQAQMLVAKEQVKKERKKLKI